MVSRNKLTVLPNGVDVDAWRPNASVGATVRQDIGVRNEFLWLAAGRLDTVKDYSTLLRAMHDLPAWARLVLAGEGPQQNDLRQLSARLGLEHRVRFLGFEPDIKRWMQAADGFVLSSHWEGLPMALLEAAACALPTVATEVAGTREIILKGWTGWMAPAGDADALSKEMLRVMQTPPEERRAMGERARQQVIARFSLESVLDRWERLYAELLGKTYAERHQMAQRLAGSQTPSLAVPMPTPLSNVRDLSAQERTGFIKTLGQAKCGWPKFGQLRPCDRFTETHEGGHRGA
jgi:glycosyltransferase involved in cell wall biosynthesis